MKINKKGMTLVECIIAMAVFSIATTGFVMAASVCMRSQAKAGTRMTKTNTQTTNLEHFSTFAHVLDPSYSNVRPMASGTNQFQMTFQFPTDTVVNDKIYGYYSTLEDEDEDGVFELSFFSAADQVTLGEGEYWVTLYNYDGAQQTLDITCPDDFSFFDNEKNDTAQQTLPRHIWAPEGGYMKFGIKAKSGGGAPTVTIHSVEGNFTDKTLNIADFKLSEDENYCNIYYTGAGTFLTPEDFDSASPE